MSTPARVLIIVPTYNERANLVELTEKIFLHAPAAELLIVDDASPDGTGELAETMARDNPRLSVLHRQGKLGLASAYLEGFRLGLERGYDIILEMDADLSHDPRDVPRLVAALEHADIAIGSRAVPGGAVIGWGPLRHVISRGGSLYSRLWLDLPIHDATTGFKAFRAEVLRALPLDRVRSEGYAFQIELNFRALRAGFRIVEVPILFVDRRAGQSKMSRRIFAEAALVIPRLRLMALRGEL